MADHRLLRVFSNPTQAQIESVFGDYLLAPPISQPLARVKKVAILAEAFLPKVDGVSKTAYLTVRYLQETGREVIVFAPDIAVSSVGDSKVVPLPSLGMRMAPETRMALPHPAVAKHISEFQPDLIHLFSPALMSINGVAMAHHLHIPVIANYQTDLPGYTHAYGLTLLSNPMRYWLRYIHNQCHLTLVPSETIKSQLQDWGFRRLCMWQRGVNTQRFHPEKYSPEMRQRLLNGRDEDSLLCLYVGRLADEKGVDLLLDVARLPGVALTIIGDGAKRDSLEELFADTNTHFTGYLYGEELAIAYASADVFTFTGRNETFGQVVQEAMASGLPIVVVDEGGSKDLIEDGKSGFVCHADPQAFAQAVVTLRDNLNLRDDMGKCAFQAASSRPWWKIMAQLESYYHKAMQLNIRFVRRYHHKDLYKHLTHQWTE